MMLKGFTKTDNDKADLLLGHEIGINIGTLVLSIYDPAAKQLVWIGAAQHAIDPPRSRTRTGKI